MVGWLVSKLCLVLVSFRDRLKPEGVYVCWNHVKMGTAISDLNYKALFSDTKGQSLPSYFHVSLPPPHSHQDYFKFTLWMSVCVHMHNSLENRGSLLFKASLEVTCFRHSSHNHSHISKTREISVNLLTKCFQMPCGETWNASSIFIILFFSYCWWELVEID